MDTNSLLKFGLTRGEITVYLTLLETGRAPISVLSAKTKHNRTSLYDIIDGLVKKGLVSYIFEEKKKYFEAAKPQRLLEYAQQKEEELAKEKVSLKDLIGDLQKISPLLPNNVHVQIYRGRKGLITILEDVLVSCKKGDETLAFGLGGSNMIRIVGPYYKNYIKRSTNKEYGISFRAIFNQSEKNDTIVKNLGAIPLTKVKFSFEKYDLPTQTRVYANKVAIIILEKDPVAILIEDKKIADGYRYFFEFLWKLAK